MFSQEEVLKEALKCSGCGFCLSVCPVYLASGIETISSRGRMDVLRGLLLGELEASPRINEVLSTCLMCRSCEGSCPPGVKSQKIVLELRRRRVVQKGLPVAKLLAFRRLIRDKKALRKALAMLAHFQRPLADSGHYHLRYLPSLFSGLTGGRALPPIARRSLSQRLPEIMRPGGGVRPRGKVGFFSGCFFEFVDTPTGEAVVRTLVREGFEVFFPKAQVCCGAPALYGGDMEGAASVAVTNANVFAERVLDAIVVPCATCAMCIKEGYGILLNHLKEKDTSALEGMREKAVDFAVFLNQKGLSQRLALRDPLLVTYHDPCHHIRGLSISDEPRALLSTIQNLTLKEMSEPAKCCGGGGTFSLTNPEISVEIGSWKVKDIMETGAQAVVTACPGCILQMQDVAHRQGARFHVMHIAEVLDMASPSKG